jgi:hypothetical protein
MSETVRTNGELSSLVTDGAQGRSIITRRKDLLDILELRKNTVQVLQEMGVSVAVGDTQLIVTVPPEMTQPLGTIFSSIKDQLGDFSSIAQAAIHVTLRRGRPSETEAGGNVSGTENEQPAS